MGPPRIFYRGHWPFAARSQVDRGARRGYRWDPAIGAANLKAGQPDSEVSQPDSAGRRIRITRGFGELLLVGKSGKNLLYAGLGAC